MPERKEKDKCRPGPGPGPAGAVYGFGFLGALVYFIQHADTFWMGVLGILKALVWPALLVYKILEYVK
jgi:hypothetical protein